MGALDTITQMKSQGRSNAEIIQVLQSQGIPPKDIQDALSQAQIKSAVEGDQTAGMQQSIMENPPMPQDQAQTNQNQGYIPQPTDQYSQDAYTQDQYSGAYPTQDSYQDQYAGGAGGYDQYGSGGQDTYSQDAYSAGGYDSGYGYGSGTSYSGGDANSLIEISEQVFSEKVKKVQETIDSLNEFKALTDAKVKTMEQRLKRIETTIDQLQVSILNKIGSYGKNLGSIKKEMAMMQDSFGKLINPILDRKKRK